MRNYILKQKLNSIKIKLWLCKITQNRLPFISNKLKKQIDAKSQKIFKNIDDYIINKIT